MLTMVPPAAARKVRLEIFDARGRLVRIVHDGVLAAGDHQLAWNGRDDSGRALASGVYVTDADWHDVYDRVAGGRRGNP